MQAAAQLQLPAFARRVAIRSQVLIARGASGTQAGDTAGIGLRQECCSTVSVLSLPVFAVLNVEKVQHAGLWVYLQMLKRHTTLGRIHVRSEDSHA